MTCLVIRASRPIDFVFLEVIQIFTLDKTCFVQGKNQDGRSPHQRKNICIHNFPCLLLGSKSRHGNICKFLVYSQSLTISELLLTRERRILLRTASGASRFLYITVRYGSLFVDLQPHFGSRSRDTSHEHIARDPKASCEVARSNIDQI